MTGIIAALLLFLAIGGVVVRKTYYALPLHELKRRASRREPVAAKLYQAAAYGRSLRGLLWLVIAGSSAGGFVLLVRFAPAWLSLLAVIGLLWMAFSWLPASRVTPFGIRLTSLVTPALTWLLSYTYPLLDRVTGLVERRYPAGERHTGLFERNDLLQLIERQTRQADSRFTPEQLAIVKRALRFDDHRAADVLTPAKAIKTLLANDTVGPILINELYQQSQKIVLVRESPTGPVIGTLEASRLDLKSTGRVRDLMDQTVYYVHENDSLSEVLRAFSATNCPLFVVVNSAEEYIGIVSVQDILQALLGQFSGDDFDQFTNLSAVAARHTKRQPSEPSEAEELVQEVAL